MVQPPPPPSPKKNPGSAPVSNELFSSLFLCFSEENELDSSDLSNKRSSQAHQDDHNKKRSGIIVPSKGRQVQEIRQAKVKVKEIRLSNDSRKGASHEYLGDYY